MYKSLMFNEELLAKEIYEKGFTNREYSFYESILVAKYFRHILGYGDAKVKTALKDFCKNKIDFFVEVPNWKNIKSAVTKSRRPFIDKSNPISVTQNEINIIKRIEGYKQRKLLFAILVLAKLNNAYLNNNDWNKIRRVLHSKITNKNISELMQIYDKEGLLYSSYKGYYKILFVDFESPPVFSVSSNDIDNLKKVFEEIFGKDLFVCCDCNNQYERKSYNQKRCHECSENHKREKWRLQKIRQRSKMSTC